VAETKKSSAVNCALHGYGYIGRTHVLAQQLNVAAAQPSPIVNWHTAVVHDTRGSAALQAQRVFEHVTDTLDEMDGEEIDAIDIASPNDVHFAPFAWAVQNKVAVYCEKPISHRVEEAAGMVDMAHDAGIVHQVALVFRFHPAVMEARDWLLSGSLGRVLTFRAELQHGGYLDASRPMSWRLRDKASGGGAVMDLGIHMFDLVHLLLGDIKEVAATTRTFVPARSGAQGLEQVDVDDWSSAVLEMESGAVGTVEVSRVHYGRERDMLEIVCERGVLHLPLATYVGAEVHLLDDSTPRPRVKRDPVLNPFNGKYAQGTLLNLHATSLATFSKRVFGEPVDYPVPTLKDALAAQLVADAVLRSGVEHRPVPLRQIEQPQSHE
jgi:predicted dehydrogenase